MQQTEALFFGAQHDEDGASTVFSLVIFDFRITGISEVFVSIVLVFSHLLRRTPIGMMQQERSFLFSLIYARTRVARRSAISFSLSLHNIPKGISFNMTAVIKELF